MADTVECLSSFSNDGKYFASCISEQLKIWDADSKNVFQTFNPRGKVNCLAWSKVKQSKPKSSSGSGLVCVGVEATVLVWNLVSGEEIQVLSSQHSDEVLCVTWCIANSNHLYSGSKDAFIVHWDVLTGQCVRRWKADRKAVHSLCCYGDGELLLSAGRTIKIWNLNDYSLIKKVTGHASSVHHLVCINEDFFMSSAINDRLINIWQCATASKAAVASLVCEEEVRAYDCYCAAVSDIRVVVLSQHSCLLLYQFSLANMAGPLTAQSSLQYASSHNKNSSAIPLPILSISLAHHDPLQVLVAYGSPLKPAMEAINFDVSSLHQCMVRDVARHGLLMPSSTSCSIHDNTPTVTVLGPGNMTVATHHQHNDPRPLTERLKASGEMKTEEMKSSAPSTDSLTQLLVQSVTSGDGKLLEEVLRVPKEKIISATVRKLPVHVVLPFMKKLIELLQRTPARGLELSLWIKKVLSLHAAYLMTVPQLSESLGGLYELLEARVATFSRLCLLQGKLDLLLAHASEEEQGLAAAQVALTTPTVAISLGESYPVEETGSEEDEEDWKSESEVGSSDEDSEEDIMADI